MTENPPPIPPPAPTRKSSLPTWAIVLLIVGVVGVIGIFVIGMLAAIAIPNFVRARETAQRNACVNYLRMIDGAKQQWALEHKKESTEAPTESDLVSYLRDSGWPMCPAGGQYTINVVGETPTCTIPEHELPSDVQQEP